MPLPAIADAFLEESQQGPRPRERLGVHQEELLALDHADTVRRQAQPPFEAVEALDADEDALALQDLEALDALALHEPADPRHVDELLDLLRRRAEPVAQLRHDRLEVLDGAGAPELPVDLDPQAEVRDVPGREVGVEVEEELDLLRMEDGLLLQLLDGHLEEPAVQVVPDRGD